MIVKKEPACSEVKQAGVPIDRVIEIAKGRPENPENLDRFAIPEDRPLGLGRLGLPDRLPFLDCQVKAILHVDAKTMRSYTRTLIGLLVYTYYHLQSVSLYIYQMSPSYMVQDQYIRSNKYLMLRSLNNSKLIQCA